MSRVRFEVVEKSISLDAIPMRPTSLDIRDKKCCLKTRHGESLYADTDTTYPRVARALADAESSDGKRVHWVAVTGTSNCTVSASLSDSIGGNLQKAHKAGLTLSAGCGIGYEFSSLRPCGAFVAGAGVYTLAPMSSMDIFGRRCFTVASAGDRCDAQIGTFDVLQPDLKDFVHAKREDGRLRQFNPWLLTTDCFMNAIKRDAAWSLLCPINAHEQGEPGASTVDSLVWGHWPVHGDYLVRDDGLVACRFNGEIRARHSRDMIAIPAYDNGESGFILTDRIDIALVGRAAGLALASGKGPAPIMEQRLEATVRFTHSSSIATTGTIPLSLANNASNGIEPSFAHHYSRNVIREGRKFKANTDVFSLELLAYQNLVDAGAMPLAEDAQRQLPDDVISAEDASPWPRAGVQTAAQIWIDSAISKTANVPTNSPYEQLTDICRYADERDLKACTTLLVDPAAFKGVLVKTRIWRKPSAVSRAMTAQWWRSNAANRSNATAKPTLIPVGSTLAKKGITASFHRLLPASAGPPTGSLGGG